VMRCSVDDHAAMSWPEEVSVRIVTDRAILLPAPEAAVR
jgi:hypothetical protein